jgi:hypothetical protein
MFVVPKYPKQILIDYDEYLELEKRKDFYTQCVEYMKETEFKREDRVPVTLRELTISFGSGTAEPVT